MTQPQPAQTCRLFALAFTLIALTGVASASDRPRPAPFITPYDLATRDDLLLSRLVATATAGDVDEWSKSLLGGMTGQVGDWVNRYFDATAMANIITTTFAIEGQPALGPVDTLIADSAQTLGMDKPTVLVRNSPDTRIYAVQAGGRDHLILTSGLLNLFEGRPDELKFVVGRELGHIKCGHMDLKRKAYAVLTAVHGINAAVVPDRYQDVLPVLALGRLFTWCREAEFSADRAGLLCCGEPKTAYEAIMRLQHGLRADSIWIDPTAEGFNSQAIIRDFREWQYQPFAKFILHIQAQTLDNPYYQERLAVLKAWADTGTYRDLLARRVDSSDNQLIEIVKIQAFELAAAGQTVDPYVIATDGDRQVLRTGYLAAVRDAEWKGFKTTDPGVDQPRAFRNGQPLYFEIWDADYGIDPLIGGFIVYPTSAGVVPGVGGERMAEYTVRILWDWQIPQMISRAGHARVWVRFTTRRTPAATGAARKVK